MISKRIYPSFWFGGDQAVRLLNTYSRGFDRCQMQKFAASDYIMAIDVKPSKGFSFVHIITTGAGEYYGCVAGNTPTSMADGSHIHMEDVRVGDYVLSGSGNIRQVLTKYERDVPYYYKVDVEGIPEPLLLSANHPMEVAKKEQFVCGRDKHMRTFPETVGLRSICRRRDSCDRCQHLLEGIREERVVAEDLRPGDHLLFKVPVVKADFELTEEEAVMMGYWLAEGCFQRNGSNQAVSSLRFNFGLHEKDTLVPVCKQAAEREGWNTAVYPQENRSCALLTANGNPERSREWLAWFGSGARNKKIPLWMYTQPIAVRMQLLKAYFEGDGHVDKVLVYGHSASYDLAAGIQRLLWSVGIPATMNEVQKDQRGYGYHVSYQRNKAAGTVLGFGTEERPSLKIRTFVDRGTAYLPVRTVTRIDSPLHVHNMEVEEDHDYVSGGIYSHNCNNNADYYNEKEATVEIPDPKPGTDRLVRLEGGLLCFHPTFTKYGAVYREHVNSRKGGIPQGEVFAEAYNPVMHRGELVLKLDDDQWQDDLQKLSSGEPVFWSIGCGVPEDICSVCGNRARTRKEYCFRGDMLVTMDDFSLKPISEVVRGDFVLDAEGKSVQVLDCRYRTVQEDVVHLTTSLNNLETVATKEHPFLSSFGEDFGKCFYQTSAAKEVVTCFPGILFECQTCRKTVPPRSYKAAGHLRRHDVVYQAIPSKEQFRDMSFVPKDMRVFGLFMAEGCYEKIKGKRTGISFSLNGSEIELIEELRQYFDRRYGKKICVYPQTKGKGVSVRIHSVDIADFFYRTLGEYAHLKYLPRETLHMSLTLLEHYVSGLWDGDGCVSQRPGRTGQSTLVSVSFNLIHQTKLLLDLLGYDTYTASQLNMGGPSNRTNKRQIYRLQTDYRLGPLVRNQRTRGIVGGMRAGIVKKTWMMPFEGRVYNLTTESGSYMVNDIVVHNCDDMKYNRLGLTKTGHQVFVYNDRPHFHDISRVAVPADRIAFALRKVASQGDILVEDQETGDWLPLSVMQKIGTQTETAHARALEKAAEIEKRILAQGMTPDQKTVSGALSSRKLNPKTLEDLQRYPLQDVCFELNKRAVLLPISDFARIVMRKKPAEDVPGLGKVGSVLNRLFSDIERSGSTEVVSDAAYTPLSPRSWAGLSAAADSAQRDLSMEEDPIRSRIVKVAMQEPMRKTATAEVPGAESKRLAMEYAKYQLSFLTGAGIDKYAMATVLVNQSVE